jgi:diguanylate cyclase (GGDEF)-like protein
MSEIERIDLVGEGGSLARRIGAMRDAVARVAAGPATPEDVATVRRLTRRLIAGAGPGGFGLVSRAAARLDEEVTREAADVSRIRAACDELAAALEASPVVLDAPVASPMRSARRVLLVGEDDDATGLAAATARRHLVEPLVARDEPDALRLARSLPIDAAILDDPLPGGASGCDLARSLRTLPGYAALPIALLSPDRSTAARVAAAHAGASVYLEKPADPAACEQALLRLLADSRHRPRVFVAGGDPAFVAQILGVLGPRGMDVCGDRPGEDVLVAIEREDPDLVLLAAGATGDSAVDLCRALRMTPRWEMVPILFVTRTPDVDARLAAFEAGADDWLLEPVIPQELVARVQVRLDRAQLQRERADRDSLTGLPNRRVFLEQLAARLSEARRRRSSLALVLLDVDGFKCVNDDFGHAAGDAVLAGIGRLFGSRFRAGDLRARWGGDELALAFPGEEASTIGPLMDLVRADLASQVFTAADGVRRFRVTFSAGIAECPADGDQPAALMATADRRLYLAKSEGRNRVVSEG